jgi:hypothetical protein
MEDVNFFLTTGLKQVTPKATVGADELGMRSDSESEGEERSKPDIMQLSVSKNQPSKDVRSLVSMSKQKSYSSETKASTIDSITEML